MNKPVQNSTAKPQPATGHNARISINVFDVWLINYGGGSLF